MKKQKKYLQKTHHFLLRAWQRGFYHSSIEKLTFEISPVKVKTFYLINRKKLKELNISIESHYLIIVVKEDCLVTLFELDDLWSFMKINKNFIFKPINLNYEK